MKTLIFDFDGTIADSFETLLAIFEEILPRQEKLSPAEIDQLRGQPLKDILKYLRIRKWQIPRLLIKGRRALGAKIAGIKPFSGLAPILKALHDDGYKMYIVSTNGATNINQFLKANNLENYFAKIYGDIGLRKGAALKKILRKEKLDTKDCIYIGDEVRDAEAARKAGVSHVAVGWGFNHPGILKNGKPAGLAEKPKDLLTIIKNLNT